MNKRIITLLLVLIFTQIQVSVFGQKKIKSQPNVIIVITDDQGYGDLGCHGNDLIRTPNIDEFYNESSRLTNFHVSPTCAPTRASLMTGRFANRVGVWHTIAGRSILWYDETTMSEVFKENGYTTGLFGKWHLGDNYPSRPKDRGFDEVLVHGGGGITQGPDFWANDYFDDTYRYNGSYKKFEGYFFSNFSKFFPDIILICVMHNFDKINFFDKILLIENGKLEFNGDYKNLKENNFFQSLND